MRYEKFSDIRQAVSACENCKLCETRKNTVFGEGSVHADVMFIGEGPGAVEDELGRPFVGPAGQLLEKMLASIGLSRSDVYIANIVKCRPPFNADPLPQYAEKCMPYLRSQIAFIRPKVLVLLGKVPTRFILGEEGSMSGLHGKIFRKGAFYIMPTYHPSALLRSENLKRPAWEDLKALRRLLDDISGVQKSDQ